MSLERVFVGLQFPIPDLRPLVPGFPLLSAPTWPTPVVNKHFVRGVGVVRGRPKGSPLPILGEGSFVDGTRLTKSAVPYEEPRSKSGRPTLRRHYTRIYGLGTGYRVDLGFKAVIRQSDSLKTIGERVAGKHYLLSAADYLHIPLHEFGLVYYSTELAHATIPTTGGEELKQKFGLQDNQVQPWLSRALVPGSPLLVVERWKPNSALHITAETIHINSRTIPTWELTLDPNRPSESRSLRAAIWRLHYEHEVLARVITIWRANSPGQIAVQTNRHLRTKTLPIDEGRLLDYLDSTTRLLVKRSYRGHDQHSLMALASLAGGGDTPLLSSLTYLRSEAKAIAKRVDIILERTALAKAHVSALANVVDNRDGKRVEIIMGDKFNFENSENINVVNRSKDVSIHRDGLASPEVASELRALRDAPEINEQLAAVEIVDALIVEVEGPKRFEVARQLWAQLQSSSPVISMALASASLTNALLS